MIDSVCLKEIGQRIIKRREYLGLSQKKLAEKIGLTTQFIYYAEHGKREMRLKNLLKLSIALETSVDYLLTGEITDKDLFLLSEKLKPLTERQLRIIENIIDVWYSH